MYIRGKVKETCHVQFLKLLSNQGREDSGKHGNHNYLCDYRLNIQSRLILNSLFAKIKSDSTANIILQGKFKAKFNIVLKLIASCYFLLD